MKTLALVLLLVSATAQAAPKFETVFHASYWIGGRKTVIDTEGSVKLPSTIAVAGWSCQITGQNLTDDGEKSYRNIACINGGSAVRASCACPLAAAGADVANFTLSVYGDDGKAVAVDFYLSCTTTAKGGTVLAPGAAPGDQDI